MTTPTYDPTEWPWDALELRGDPEENSTLGYPKEDTGIKVQISGEWVYDAASVEDAERFIASETEPPRPVKLVPARDSHTGCSRWVLEGDPQAHHRPADVAEAVTVAWQAREAHEAAQDALHEAIRTAIARGTSVYDLRSLTGLSRERIYQIRDNRR